jgi:hypothetical protein
MLAEKTVFAPIIASLQHSSNSSSSSSSSPLASRESIFTPVFNLTHLSIGRLDNHYDDHQRYTAAANADSAAATADNETTTSGSTDNTTSTTTATKTGFEHPHSLVIRPVYEQIHDQTSRIVGLVQAIVAWDVYLVDLLASDLVIPKNGFYGVLRNSCGQAYSYSMDGQSVRIYLHLLREM